MKHQCQAAALLLLGLACVISKPAQAQERYRWDTACGCRRPDFEYYTRRYERMAPRIVTHERVVDHTRVVRGDTRLIQENRLIVHVRPVVIREVVVHRTNTIVKDVVLHRIRTTNKLREEFRREVVNRSVEGSLRHILVRREVRAANCGCGLNRRRYRTRYQGEHILPYRD
jgi:hypothetical protein